MKTLTITDAKKNLGHWLTEAAKGNDIGIISGSDIIALRKVEVESVDYAYAYHEYGATPEEVRHFEKAVEKRYHEQKKAGKLVTVKSRAELEKAIEKASRH